MSTPGGKEEAPPVAMVPHAWSAYIACAVLAFAVYKIVSVYVRKSILPKGRAFEGQDNKVDKTHKAEEVSGSVEKNVRGEEDVVAAVEEDEVKAKAVGTATVAASPKKNNVIPNNNNNNNNSLSDGFAVGGISRNGVKPGKKIVSRMGKEDLIPPKCEQCSSKDAGDTVDGSGPHHKAKKRHEDLFVEQLHLVDLLQAGITAEELDTLQPPIEVCEWFACRYQCDHTTYDLKVTLQDEHKQPIVEFYYGYDFSKEPKGIWKKVSNTFKKYGPGIRFIHFRHKIGKEVEVNDGRYNCVLSDGVLTVSRNKAT